MIELKDFVAETLKNLIDGIKTAQEYASTVGATVNPATGDLSVKGEMGFGVNTRSGQLAQIIEFDIAITANEGTQVKGGAGIFVGPVGIGSQGQSDRQRSAESRVKFSVPVFLPTQKIK